MSRIKETTELALACGRKLLIPYLVAGDPDLSTTLALMHDLVTRGADVIELGVPFSDPSADGPVIQRGVERALATGTSLTDVMQLVRRFRLQDTRTPVVLMGYLNPVEIMGYENFADATAAAGVDGVLLVDMPPSEATELSALLRARQVDLIFLIAPTTSASRAAAISAQTTGYLYYVSLKGVTGAALQDHDSVKANITRLRGLTDLPIVIGFGIKDAESAAAMATLSDGVIIGSALVEQIEKLAIGAEGDRDMHDTAAVISAARKAIGNIK
jgi:tryptophan synthase alpha chain